MQAVALALGAQLGLDETTTRRHISKKAGRPLAELDATGLAPVLRAMAEALGRDQRAA